MQIRNGLCRKTDLHLILHFNYIYDRIFVQSTELSETVKKLTDLM